jgi:sugar phosphate isomerase/epimerase
VAVLAAVTHAAADLAAPVMVVYASPFALPAAEVPTRQAALLRTCAALAPGARQAGIRYALENVLPGRATELVTRVLDDLDPAVFGFCYHSAHDQIGGPRPFTLLRQLGARLIAVQLSDRIRDYVDHVLPGDGFIDWPGRAPSCASPPSSARCCST